MRILVYSKEGDSGGLAWQMQKEGATVDLFIKENWARRQMDGIVPKVETLEEGLKNKPNFIIFDQNGDGKTADRLRTDGWKVVGGSDLSDRMEFDRGWGVKLCKQYGIKTPETTEFSNVQDAIGFVKKNPKAYAIKCDDNAGGESASFVAKDADEMVDYLSQQKESGKLNASSFIIQDCIRGAEVSTELWFCGGEPVWPANSTFETKKFLAGELGQRTGCEVSLVCHYEGNRAKIVDRTLRKLFPLLKYAKFTGCLDVNCIVNEKDNEPYFLEFTPRLGYSAIYAYTTILGLPISEYFERLTKSPFTIPFKTTWGTALKVSIPPYPTVIDGDKAQADTYGLQEGVRINGEYKTNFVPIDVQKGKKTEFEAGGVTCIIGECLGRGNSVLEAWRTSQRVFKGIELPNKQGRYTDGIDDLFKRSLKLRNMGYDIPKPSGEGRSSNPLSQVPSPV